MVKRKKINLGGCQLILKKGRAPQLKVPKSKRKQIAKIMDGGIDLADKGIKTVNKRVKLMSKEMPSVRRKMRRRGRKLTRKITKGIK